MKTPNFYNRVKRFFRGKSNIDETILSPDGKIRVIFHLKQGHMSYEVFKNDKILVRDSRLGLKLKGIEPFYRNLTLVRIYSTKFDETWETVWGEEREIRNNFCSKTFFLEEKNNHRILTLKFRVFDDGVAFRYEIPPQPSFSRLIIEDELTEFRLDLNANAWQIPAFQPDRYEYNYERKQIFELNKPVHTPLTVENPTGHFLSIHEAALYDYGEMTLALNEWHSLKSNITPLSDGMKAYVELPFSTPWRVIMIADSAAALTQNRITLNLNDPPKNDFSWVKPLKFFGIWWAMYVGEWTWAQGERHGATTKHALKYLNSCESLGIKGLLIEGWNDGWEGDWLQNGADTNFSRATSDFNLPEVARYAENHNLYLIGHHETVGFVDNYEQQLDTAYNFYHKNNIKYIKTGYAGSMMTINGEREWHHSQLGVKHYQKSVELAAKYGICLDIHEPIKGTGIERTWPNLLTREGARGQEYEGGAILPSHATILPFTRLLAGGMDYTSGIFDITNTTKRIATTIAKQLAFFIVIPSGMQMLADRPEIYEQYPNWFKFLQSVPVNWEKTVPLLAKIGEYYVVARQSRENEDWFIGGVTNEDSRQLEFNLDFLDDGEYFAEAYFDTRNAHFRDNPLAMELETWPVNNKTTLKMFLAPGGGFAIRIHKNTMSSCHFQVF